MGTDIVLFRFRIGIFKGGRGYTPSVKFRYNPFVNSNDIHYRVFSCCLVLLFITFEYSLVIKSKTWLVEILSSSENVCGIVLKYGMVTMYDWCMLEHSCAYVSYSQRLLMLSMDIEENPGPTDTEQVLAAISELSSTNVNIMEQLVDLKSEIGSVKSVVDSVNSELSHIKNAVKVVEGKQLNLETKFNALEAENVNLQYMSEVINSDIASFSLNLESHDSRLERLEQQLDYFESVAKKNNLRIFGLPGDDQEGVSTLKSKIVNEVLKQACSAILKDSISFAKRIGSGDNYESRMVLVKFKSFDVKLAIFEARDSVRAKRIKVSSDLTTYQRSELKKLSNSGRKGYFKNGRLVILPTEENQKSIPGPRTFKRQRLGDITEEMEHDTSHEPGANANL